MGKYIRCNRSSDSNNSGGKPLPVAAPLGLLSGLPLLLVLRLPQGVD